jgi:hypothetical protein
MQAYIYTLHHVLVQSASYHSPAHGPSQASLLQGRRLRSYRRCARRTLSAGQHTSVPARGTEYSFMEHDYSPDDVTEVTSN